MRVLAYLLVLLLGVDGAPAARVGSTALAPPPPVWKTLPPSRGDDELLAAAKREGLFAPWSLTGDGGAATAAGFESFSDFRAVVWGKKILVIGDSIQMNFFITANNLWRGKLPDSSWGNTKHPKLHLNRANYFARARVQSKWGHHASPFYSLNIEAEGKTRVGRCVQDIEPRITKRALRNWKDDPMTTDQDVVDSITKNFKYYTAGTLFQFAYMTLDDENSCFRDYLMEFDYVIFGAEVHDLQESEKFYRYNERKERYLALAKEMLAALKQGWDGKYRTLVENKLVWVSGVTWGSKTPAHFRKAQQDPDLDVKVKNAVTSAGVLYVDQLEATGVCTWRNCTVEDNHYSRFVNRQKVLRTFARVRDRQKAKRLSRADNSGFDRTNRASSVSVGGDKSVLLQGTTRRSHLRVGV